MQLHLLPDGSPRVAVLTPAWSRGGECSWAVRQVAAALAGVAEIHVVTTEGAAPVERADGVFVIHELATADRGADLRRDAVLHRMDELPQPARDEVAGRAPLAEALASSLRDPWVGATEVVSTIKPDLVVVADFRQIGAFEAAHEGARRAALVLVPLATVPRIAVLPLFGSLLADVDAALYFTEGERTLFAARIEQGRVVSLPLSRHDSVLREPEPRVREWPGYVLALTDSDRASDDEWLELLSMACAGEPLVIASPARLTLRPAAGHAPVRWDEPTRRHDLLRLMAWARATVDLHPGTLFGRESVESLLHSTPIVVPANSSAREHAELGSGGLWFDELSGLLGCVETMRDPATRDALAHQGAAYAQARCTTGPDFVASIARTVHDVARTSPQARTLAEQMAATPSGSLR